MPPPEPQSVDRLVSLNWDHPLPSAVVILALRPRDVTIVAPRIAESAAKRLCRVVGAHGIDARLRLGADPTDLDAGESGRSMRDVIGKAITGEDLVLDYTGGSKVMAAIARLQLGSQPDAASRSVYLDVSTGLVRWDDGHAIRPDVTLSARELGELHGTKVTHVGRPEDRPDLVDEVAADAPRLLGHLSRRSRVRPVFWKDLLRDIDLARGPSRSRDEESTSPAERKAALRRLRGLASSIDGGSAHVLPLGLERSGDWLELYVADRVKAAAVEKGVAVDVSINVEARRQTGARVHPSIAQAHPSARALLAEARRASTGAGEPGSVEEALQRALDRSGGREDDRSQETDLEIDVLVVRGHRAYALSCYAGSVPERVEWKAHEIARRAVQIGGDFARAAFVCLVSARDRDALQERLTATHLGEVRVRVFGLSDLLNWASDPRDGLADFLELSPRHDGQTAPPPREASPEHDLLVTVGGTPIPVLQSVLAHGAQSPLLVHTTGSRRTAHLLCEVLRERAIEARTLEAGSGFLASEVASALRVLPPSVAVDITGGTKVLSVQALLHHLEHGDLQGASYVDGVRSMVRRLAPQTPAQGLPTEIRLGELLHLHDRRVSGHDPIEDAAELPGWPRKDRVDVAGSRQAARWVARGVLAELGSEDEILAGAELEHCSRGATERFDVIVRAGARLGVLCVLWGGDHRDVAQAAWKPILAGQDLGGTYVLLAVVAPLDEWGRKRVERKLQRRSAGAPRTVVFGRDDLERWREGDRAALAQWITS